MIKKYVISAAFLFAVLLGTSQNHVCFDSDPEVLSRMQEVLMQIATENAEGRAPGTAGDQFTTTFIADHFERMQLEPKGEDGSFLQGFIVFNPVNYDLATMQTKKGSLEVKTDFYPVRYSSEDAITGKTKSVKYGIRAPKLKRDDLKRITSLEGRIAVLNISSPDGIHPHSAFREYTSLQKRIDDLIALGASGIILINPDQNASDPSPEFTRIKTTSVPVVFVTDPKAAKYLKRWSRKNVTINTKMAEQPVATNNVIAYKDNQADLTVVVGAHHDHLGYGNSSSRYRGEPQIHFGADDNASGVAALLEVANYFATDTLIKETNILFIAFGAEEMGLLGSKFWTSSPTIMVEKINYMLNMDMIGRMDEKRTLIINGTGTSDLWSKVLETKHCYEYNGIQNISGVGPSDHTSFYNLGIPVLHFFTGTHEDYHKPSDAVEKINFEGIELVANMVKSMIIEFDKQPKMSFAKTETAESGKAPSFSVTLGVVPDYVFSGKGMRLDGVSKGKPAEKAGLQRGDIIQQIGDMQIHDVHSYMQALSALRKGQAVEIALERDGKKRTVKVNL
ncbi:MAG: M28 family peptidase [Schleiferiaceae bacterium]|nr:M28 family peptidase [Schleiferiaceae bacterium]